MVVNPKTKDLSRTIYEELTKPIKDPDVYGLSKVEAEALAVLRGRAIDTFMGITLNRYDEGRADLGDWSASLRDWALLLVNTKDYSPTCGRAVQYLQRAAQELDQLAMFEENWMRETGKLDKPCDSSEPEN